MVQLSKYILNKNRILLNAIASILLAIYFIAFNNDLFTIFTFLFVSIIHLVIYFRSRNLKVEIFKSNLDRNRTLGNLFILNLVLLFSLVAYKKVTSYEINDTIQLFVILISIVIFVLFNFKVFFDNKVK